MNNFFTSLSFMFNSFEETIEFSLEILNFIALGLTIILLCFFSWFYVIYAFNALRKKESIKLIAPKNKFAILIPARNESKVIKNILNSLKNQNYDSKLYDVYVIIETLEDPTSEIVNQFGDNFHLIVRTNLEGRRTKGFALDDAYQSIKKFNIKYDAYLIFDADNIVSKDYLLTMNSIKELGYDIGAGYRNFTNASKNWISLTSGILFSFVNEFTNEGKSKYFEKTNLTGTGYFISADILDRLGGWLWTGMTEDVELTYFAHQNNLKMKYYSKVHYFDEQATDFKTLHSQHVRWVWGYMNKEKKKTVNKEKDSIKSENKLKRFFRKFEQKLGIYPFLIFTVSELVVWLIDRIFGFICLGLGSSGYIIQNAFIFGTFHLLILYLTFVIVALFTICIDKENQNFTLKQRIKSVVTYPIFFFDFVLAYFDGLIHKNKRTNWKIIKHSGEILDLDAKNLKEGKNNE